MVIIPGMPVLFMFLSVEPTQHLLLLLFQYLQGTSGNSLSQDIQNLISTSVATFKIK